MTSNMRESAGSTVSHETDLGGGGLESRRSAVASERRIMRTVVALLVALASFFPVATWASSAETHAGTIATLDEKQENVLALSALSAAASIAVSAVPADVGGSISDQLAELSSDLAVIVVAILTEKYLLTVVGLVSFKILVPAACLLYALSLWGCFRETTVRPVSFKLAAFGILLFLLVPASAFLADFIDETYGVSSEAVVARAEEAASGENVADDEVGAGEEGVFAFVKNLPGNAIDAATEASGDLVDRATASFRNLLEAFAVMVVTSCVLPILVLLLALWLVNLLLGVDVSPPLEALKTKPWRTSAKSGKRKIASSISKLSRKSFD